PKPRAHRDVPEEALVVTGCLATLKAAIRAFDECTGALMQRLGWSGTKERSRPGREAPPEGSALTAPTVGVVAGHDSGGPPSGGRWWRWWLDTAGRTSAQWELSGPSGSDARTFLRAVDP